MPTKLQINLQIVSSVLAIVAVIIGAIFFVAPLHTLPNDVKEINGELKGVRETQIAQNEVLKSLVEVAADTKQLRRDVDANRKDIDHLQDRVDRYHP